MAREDGSHRKLQVASEKYSEGLGDLGKGEGDLLGKEGGVGGRPGLLCACRHGDCVC
jgi:hypothetical protein